MRPGRRGIVIRAATLAALATLPVSCGDSPALTLPVTVEVLDYTPAHTYELRDETLATLTTVEPFAGAAGRIWGGGAISASGDVGNTEADVRRNLAVRGAHGLHLAYTIDAGVARALDYDTFAIFTIYRELERVRTFYATLGVPDAALAPLPAYYRGRIEVFFLPLLASDNAAYVPAIDGFLLFNDFLSGNDVPLALNLGVVGHEYGHAVFEHLAWRNQLPPGDYLPWPGATVNHLRALDEGLADLFGATLVDDAAFVGRSVASLGDERDLSVVRVATTGLLAAATGDDPSTFDPYKLGAVIASALWSAGGVIGRNEVAGYVVLAEQAEAGRIGETFRIVEFLDAVAAAARANPAHQQALCAAFATALAVAGTPPCCTTGGACSAP